MIEKLIRGFGLVVWFFFRVEAVPGSIPGSPLSFYFYLLNHYLFSIYSILLNKCNNMISTWIIFFDINRKIKAPIEILYNRWISLINKILFIIVQYNYYYFNINYNFEINSFIETINFNIKQFFIFFFIDYGYNFYFKNNKKPLFYIYIIFIKINY